MVVSAGAAVPPACRSGPGLAETSCQEAARAYAAFRPWSGPIENGGCRVSLARIGPTAARGPDACYRRSPPDRLPIACRRWCRAGQHRLPVARFCRQGSGRHRCSGPPAFDSPPCLPAGIHVGPRGREIRLCRLGRHEQQLHQPAGRVVDVHQQRTGRCAILEPGVVAAIDLHQLAQARASITWLVHLGWTQLARHPKASVDHDPAHRLLGQIDAMALAQLLASQRRAEVGVAVADQAAYARLQAGRQLSVAAAATPA